MELVSGGRLADLIKKKRQNNEKFTDIEASTVISKILSAVEFIHDKGIVHRDLKPGKISFDWLLLENILVENEDDLSKIKIIDFGLSAKYSYHHLN